MIKAIETEYNGHRFRSRLEARWALFFDLIGVKWQFEPEGYQTPFGWYVPDFLLPEIGNGWLIEVKPNTVTDYIATERKLGFVARQIGLLGMVVRGDPWHIFEFGDFYCSPFIQDWSGYAVVGGEESGDFRNDEEKYGAWDCPYLFCACNLCGQVGIEFDGRSERIDCGCLEKSRYGFSHPKLIRAASVARSYRFDWRGHHA